MSDRVCLNWDWVVKATTAFGSYTMGHDTKIKSYIPRWVKEMGNGENDPEASCSPTCRVCQEMVDIIQACLPFVASQHQPLLKIYRSGGRCFGRTPISATEPMYHFPGPGTLRIATSMRCIDARWHTVHLDAYFLSVNYLRKYEHPSQRSPYVLGVKGPSAPPISGDYVDSSEPRHSLNWFSKQIALWLTNEQWGRVTTENHIYLMFTVCWLCYRTRWCRIFVLQM